MLKFVQAARKFGLHEPKQARALLLQGAENNNEQAVLYGLCGLDYIQSPADEKWETIEAAFLTPGGELEVNFPASLRRAVRSVLKPTVTVRAENVGVLGNMTFTHGGGGYRRGGVGNYNLCTTALDETAAALGTELGLMQATVRSNSSVAQDSKNRYADSNLSNAYEVLAGAFGASKLTGWGMTPRGRPPKKTLAQRLGLARSA